MAKKRKLTSKDFQLLPSSVWLHKGGKVVLSPFFLQWWEDYAERRFGDKEKVLEAGIELGYIAKMYDPISGGYNYDPIGFDYDPALYRKSLNIQDDMPIVSGDDKRHNEYQQLWKILLSEDREVMSNGK